MKSNESIDLKLDLVTGDIPDLAVYGLQFTTNNDAIAQGIYTRLSLVRGEWFADLSAGFPHWDIVGQKGAVVARAQNEYRAALLACPGVVSVEKLTVELDRNTRVMTVAWAVLGELNDTPIAGTLPVSV